MHLPKRHPYTANESSVAIEIDRALTSVIQSCLSLAVPIKQQVIQVIRKFGFVVDLLEELEVGVDHVLDVIADFVIERKASVLAGVDRETGR